MPGVRSLIVVRRTRTFEPEESPQTSYYLSSISPGKGCARTFATLIRGHWGGCEIRNHWVRDHCMREDNTRLRGYNANCVLSALRVCLIAIKALTHPDCSWPDLKERCQRYPNIAAAAILKLSAK
jgi:predicted transposase YbfD/YdcC